MTGSLEVVGTDWTTEGTDWLWLGKFTPDSSGRSILARRTNAATTIATKAIAPRIIKALATAAAFFFLLRRRWRSLWRGTWIGMVWVEPFGIFCI